MIKRQELPPKTATFELIYRFSRETIISREVIVINAYHYYKQARNAAWQCMIDVGVCSLPVKTLKITDYFHIKVIKNGDVKLLRPLESGCSLVDKRGKWTIIYDDTETLGRIRFTIAHELGHILLGHELEAGFGHYRKISEGKPITETQADEFAARLLAPACVLWALDVYTAEAIMRVCDISAPAAQFRADRMQVLRDRGQFLISPLERQVYEMFQPWIYEQKNRPK